MRYIDIEKLLKKSTTWKKNEELWKDKKLKHDFREASHDKCWYTEVNLVGQDPHIDHFRPKAKIAKYREFSYNVPLASCGYYWLANDPRNYRLCCIYANRKTGEGGKGNYFPLAEDSELLTKGGTEKEKNLLLDPCVREDVSLITFMGNQVLSSSQDMYDQLRVEVSKKIYNLEDQYIKTERNKIWAETEKTIEEYHADEITLNVCIRRLKDLVEPSARFSACAIACINSLADDELKSKLDLCL